MTRPQRLAGFALALAVAGCSPLTPEAQCFADATIEYRAAWRGAQKIRADLARGYALHVAQVRGVEVVPCRSGGARSTCLGNSRERITIPVAIDRAALARRLAALEAKMDALRPAAMAAAAPCGYGNRAGTDGPAAE